MNNKFKILTILIVISLFVTGNIFAIDGMFDSNITDTLYTFSDNEDVNSPFVVYSDDRVIVDKEINNIGLISALGSIEIDSSINESSFIYSNDTIRINGNLSSSLVIGNSVVVNGNIDKTVVISAITNVNISEDAVINSDIIIFADTVNIEGTINGNLICYSNNLNVNGTVAKDIRSEGSNINISETSNVLGEISGTYTGLSEINDKYTNVDMTFLQEDSITETADIDYIGIIIDSLILALIFFLISSKCNIFKNLITKAKEHPVYTIVSGFVSLIIIPAVLILSIFLILFGLEIIGIPLLLVYSTFMIVATVISTFVIGGMITEYTYEKYSAKLNNSWYKIVMSFVVFGVLSILACLPIIGWYVSVLLVMLSIGINVTNVFKRIDKK